MKLKAIFWLILDIITLTWCIFWIICGSYMFLLALPFAIIGLIANINDITKEKEK